MDFRSEREVEVNLLAPLFKEVLGYPEKDLEWARAVKMPMGRNVLTKQADLVVTRANKPLITVEAKRPTESVQSAFDQVDSYAFALRTPYSVITNGKHLVLRGYYSFNSRINVIDDSVDDLANGKWKKLSGLIAFDKILESIKDPVNQPRQLDEEAIKDYRRFFKRIHTAIRDSDKLDPAAAFDELSKLLFLKAAEDEWKGRGDTQSKPVLTAQMIDQWESLGAGRSTVYVNEWFRAATEELFPGVSDDQPKIALSPQALKTVLPMMQPFHVKGGDVDVKGRAFEEFLPSQLRGKGLGQFFTPRPIVDFMTKLAEISIQDVVVDFACGSGGFLIKAFEQMQDGLDVLPTGTLARIGTSREALLDDVKNKQLFGIDAEPRAARTAKMNMLMWGDGRRVVRGNALADSDHNGQPYEVIEYNPAIPESGCTLIMANPPFGAQEKEPKVLDRYELGSKRKSKLSQKTEVLFVERGLRLLRPEGRMLIVLPQGLMSGKSYADVRALILSMAEIRGIISLPTHTFVQSGVPTVNSCILYLQRFSEGKARLFSERYRKLPFDKVGHALRADADFDHDIFMGSAEYIGYEPSGRTNRAKGEKTDLDLLLADFRNAHTQEDSAIDLFEYASAHYGARSSRRREQVVRGTTRGLKTSFRMPLSETEDRLDPPYYLFRTHAMPVLEHTGPLGAGLVERKGTFRPQTDTELDTEYAILSVSSDGGITLSDSVQGEDITQKYKRVHTGDIAYNPMRANIGSFGVVPEEFDGGLVSPDYYVVESREVDPNFLVTVLRSSFYRMYIDVISTGSIRDRLYPDDFKTLRVPRLSSEQQKSVWEAARLADADLSDALKKLADERGKIEARVRDAIIGQASESVALAARFKALADEWRRDAGSLSSPVKKVAHPAYQAVIKMGPDVVPLILRELACAPGHWFVALTSITGEDATTPNERKSMVAATAAWLRWGRERGMIA